MNKTPWLATLALGLALTGCQEESSTSSNTEESGLGGLALGFSARTLDSLRRDSDSLLLTLAGPKDTIRSISRLGDTLRFDGLRTGSWLLFAEVFSSDSGDRQRTWEGSANAWIQPGRLARASLVLRRATGSLVVDVQIDDGPTSIFDDSCWRGGGADTTCLFYPIYRDCTVVWGPDTSRNVGTDTSFSVDACDSARGNRCGAIDPLSLVRIPDTLR